MKSIKVMDIVFNIAVVVCFGYLIYDAVCRTYDAYTKGWTYNVNAGICVVIFWVAMFIWHVVKEIREHRRGKA